jgi:spore coat polysaccharide biosynthesis predicted glycosyltransferase SpsG/RimJ/RimL family protein N-acetyltransferase
MKIAIRVDSSKRIGLGHAYRCLSIAKELRNLGVDVKVITSELVGSLTQNVFAEFEVLSLGSQLRKYEKTITSAEVTWNESVQRGDAESTSRLIGVDVPILLDHYGLKNVWVDALKSKGMSVHRINDFANSSSECDRTICPILWRNGIMPDSVPEDDHHTFQGNAAIPLDERLKPYLNNDTGNKDSKPNPSEILVQFGATLPRNQLERVIKSLAILGTRQQSVTVVDPDAQTESECSINSTQGPRIRVVPTLPFDKNLKRVLQSDLVIGAGGVSALERLALGKSQLVIPIAENQLANTNSIASWGLYTSSKVLMNISDQDLLELIDRPLKSYIDLVEVTQSAKLLIDGHGSKRICHFLMPNLSWNITIRDLDHSDIRTLYLWANSETVRKSSLNPSEILPKEHMDWIRKFQDNESSSIKIIDVNGIPAGQCRIEATSSENEYMLDYSIDPLFRGKGLAKKILVYSLHEHSKVFPESIYTAIVKLTNYASQNVLSKIGFVESSRSNEVVNYTWSQ